MPGETPGPDPSELALPPEAVGAAGLLETGEMTTPVDSEGLIDGVPGRGGAEPGPTQPDQPEMIEMPEWAKEGLPEEEPGTQEPQLGNGKVGRFGMGTIPVKKPGPRAIREARAAGFEPFEASDGSIKAVPRGEEFPPPTKGQ
ncbi:MAG: hypothetical protein R3313_05030 [Candidatus Saccharimonadales bacterium]|nr:hypothetical protein [Candidatus Saccharimonadales bacterium]